VTAVEGPNGAGKSVLLAVAAGLLQIRQVRVDRGPPLTAPDPATPMRNSEIRGDGARQVDMPQ
jgi:ABC-type cobalamin transport system ATPase subunit